MPKGVQHPLNAQQELAVAHLNGPMLVRAGAGTGKTTVLVERICRLIVEKHAQPHEILAVTFTEEAAREMSDRARKKVEAELGPGSADGLRTGTFHASCQQMLKRNHADFNVLDDENLWVYLRRQLDRRALPLDKFLTAANPAKFLHDFLDFFDRCSDELVNAARYQEYVTGLRQGTQALPRVSKQKEADELSREEVLGRCEEIAKVYAVVERLLEEKNLGSFGLMIVRAVQLLREKPELLKSEQERTRFLLIDEFQDCNAAQIEFAQLIGGASQNVFAVGDPDQAIYRFRGASSGAFDEFLRRFTAAATISLGENYRSTPAILAASHALITANPDLRSNGSGNAERRPLVSGRAAARQALGKSLASPAVEIIINKKNQEEAFDIAEAISAMQRKSGTRWSNFAALYRSHAHRLELMKELAARGIPYVVVGVDLFNTAVLRDLIAILRSLHSFPDDISLFRMALMPRFGIELNELQRQLSGAKRGSSLISVLDNMAAGKKLLRSIRELQSYLGVESHPTSKILAGVIKHFQFAAEKEEVKIFSEFVAKWEALSITETGLLPEFVAYLDYFLEAGGSLKSDKLEDVDAVRLMTIHAAKGLEFDHVFVLRVCSNSFPAKYQPPLFEFPNELRVAGNTDLGDSKILHQEEERRVFYVGMTRARQTLALHGKAARGKERVPLAFLRELAQSKAARNAVAVREIVPLLFDIAASSEVFGVETSGADEWLTIAAKKDWANQPLSHYLLDLYDTCPLQFKLARDWNLPAEPAAMMQFGGIMHRVLSDYYNSVMRGEAYSQAQVLEMFSDQLTSSGMEDPLQRELYAKQGAEQLERFLRESAAHTIPNVLGTEQSFEVEIAGIKVRGRIDRIDRISGDSVELIDYKTGKAKKQEDAEKSLQLAIYALAAKQQWNYNVARIVFHNLEDNSRVETTLSAKKIVSVEEKLVDAAKSMREGKFPAKPGFHCKWCGYRQLCPATEEKLHSIATASAVAVQ